MKINLENFNSQKMRETLVCAERLWTTNSAEHIQSSCLCCFLRRSHRNCLFFQGLLVSGAKWLLLRQKVRGWNRTVNSTGCRRNRQRMGSVALRSQYRLWEEKANEEKNSDNQKETKTLLAAIIWKGILMFLLHIELLQTQSDNQINK